MVTREEDYATGYKKPPKHAQFRKGKSGNPGGRPRKQKEIPQPSDLRSILERVANETVEIGDMEMTMLEVELRSLQRKAAKGDVSASRHLAKLRAEAGFNAPVSRGGGVLVVPGTVPLEEWSIAAVRQQAQFREKRIPGGDESAE